MEYETVSHRVLFGNAILAALISERRYDVISQNGVCSKESNVHTLDFFKQSPLSKRGVVTELNMEDIHIQIMLSKVG
jgi:hypothetical protein